VGKELLREKHSLLQKAIQRKDVLAPLNALRKTIEKDLAKPEDTCEKLRALAGMIFWARNDNTENKGNGFPFDTPWLTCLNQLRELADQTDLIQEKSSQETQGKLFMKRLNSLQKILKKIKDGRTFRAVDKELRAQKKQFDKLRHILRAAPFEEGKTELQRQYSTLSPKEIKVSLDEFFAELKVISTDDKQSELEKNTAKTLMKHIDKYKDQLTLEVKNTRGKIIRVPRTNNVCEHGFRDEKRAARQSCGKARIHRELDHLPAEAALAANFRHSEWVKDVFGDSLPWEHFHLSDREEIKHELTEMKKMRSSKRAPLIEARLINFPQLAIKLIIDEIPYKESREAAGF
jgi:hypothetical protein